VQGADAADALAAAITHARVRLWVGAQSGLRRRALARNRDEQVI
jgi:Holliday junction resolvasome RuvABC endonuclease subunit